MLGPREEIVALQCRPSTQADQFPVKDLYILRVLECRFVTYSTSSFPTVSSAPSQRTPVGVEHRRPVEAFATGEFYDRRGEQEKKKKNRKKGAVAMARVAMKLWVDRGHSRKKGEGGVGARRGTVRAGRTPMCRAISWVGVECATRGKNIQV